MEMTTKYNTYPKYKSSGVDWQGVVPESWSIKKLKNISSIYNGDSLNDNYKKLFASKSKNCTFYISTKDINLESSSINYKNGLYIPKSYLNKFKITDIGNTLLCIEGGSAGKKIGFTNQRVHFVNKLACFNSIKKDILNKYIFYFIYSNSFKSIFNLFMNGLIGGVSISIIKNIKIAVPPLHEQEAIANFLDDKTKKIDRAIKQKEQLIELLKERKQIIIQDAVTKGLDPSVKMKDSGVEWIGDIPEHWEVKRLGSLLSNISIKNKPHLQLLSITREKGVIIRDIEDLDSNHNFIPDDLSNYKMIEKGQFGMNKMKAWQGSYGVSKYEGIVSPAYFIFKFNTEMNGEFFNYSIRTKLYISYFASASDGVRIGQWDLSKPRMNNIPFIIPPLLEQEKIVNQIEHLITKTDKAIKLQQTQIDKLKEYKSILIDNAVTGKIKVV